MGGGARCALFFAAHPGIITLSAVGGHCGQEWRHATTPVVEIRDQNISIDTLDVGGVAEIHVVDDGCLKVGENLSSLHLEVRLPIEGKRNPHVRTTILLIRADVSGVRRCHRENSAWVARRNVASRDEFHQNVAAGDGPFDVNVSVGVVVLGVEERPSADLHRDTLSRAGRWRDLG